MSEKKVGDEIEINISKIIIPERIRKTSFGDLDKFGDDLVEHGQRHPIIVYRTDSGDYLLEDGHRRIEALKLKKRSTVIAVVRRYENEKKHKLYEFIANKQRENFSFQEEAAATEELQEFLSKEKGSATNQREIAEKAMTNLRTINENLQIAKALKETPDVFEGIKSREGALKVLKKHKLDEIKAEIAIRQVEKSKKSGKSNAHKYVFEGDFRDLIKAVPDGSVNLLCTDPPYGVEIEKVQDTKIGGSEEYGEYKDKPENYLDLIADLMMELPRIMHKNSWLVIFAAVGFREESPDSSYTNYITRNLMRLGFNPDPLPAIWHKVGSTGFRPQIHTRFGSCYEPFIYAHNGEATLIKQGLCNVFTHPTIPSERRQFYAQKPLGLMKELIRRFALPGHSVLDPFAGVGTTLCAALSLGMSPIGFELDRGRYNQCILNINRTLSYKNEGKLDLLDELVEGL